MAIQINLSGNEGTSRSNDYKEDKVPATQGNVINTLNSYNEKLKKEYYDKAQARADENALQSSLENVIQLLSKDTPFKDKIKDPNTSSEDKTGDRLEAYNGKFDEDNEKEYNVAGLVQKLNIIANLVSGSSIQAEHNWGIDAHGNNVGKEESTGSVPVIGLTRGYDEIPYNAKFSNEDNQHILKIEGLSEHSSDTVLSEKQVADMISQSVKEVLGNYDSQISVMLSYMLFAENGLPKSYEYILKNTTVEKIQDAPMYVVYDEKNDRYYVRDLDGDGTFQETEDYIIDKTNFQNACVSGITSSLAKDNKWTLQFDGSLTNLKVSYNNEEVYTLPIPQKTLTVNLGQIENETSYKLNYNYCLFNSVSYVEGQAEVINGIATINVPVAASVTVNLPSEFDGELFAKYDYTDNPENNNVSITNNQFTVKLINDQTVYAKIIKYTLKLNNGNDDFVQVKRYKSTVAFSNTFDNLGKTGFSTSETKLGGSISSNNLNVSITKIQGNTEYTDFTEGEIVDEVIWAPKSFPVKIVKVLWNGTSPSTGTSQKVDVTVSQEILYSSPVDGYVFNGIFMDENCTQPINGVLPEVNPIDNLYARYDIIKYNYSFITNGADLQGNVNEVGKVDWESDMPALPVLTRNGYTFGGWYTSPNFNGGVVTAYQKADTVYYAKWTEKTYKINFILKGDSLSENEKKIINPYFKYKSINVTTSNLPMTIGDPIADGFDFEGWSNGETIINQIDLNSFQYTDTSTGKASEYPEIDIYATWKAQEVSVKEEIYYQIDGSSSEYDLAKTIPYVGIVGQEYVYNPNVNVVDGFEEVTPTTIYTVKDKDNVVKRYFDRKTYNITYTENKNTTDSVSSSLDKTFTYSDNNIPLKIQNEVPDGYSFASWIDKNGSEVSSIPAYTHEDVVYTARYNQEAPVEGKDFSVSVDENKITITKLEHASTKTLKISMNAGVKDISGQLDISYNDVYSADSLTTAYGFVFFGEEKLGDLKIVNASNYVDVSLKFKASVPVEGRNYTSDANTRTITKIADTVELESRFGDATGYVDFSSLTLAVGQKVALRTKETFSRFASNDTDLIDFGNKKAPMTLNKEIEGIKNFEVTKKVSYNAKGEITIKRGVFEGEHGPLQYKTGTGNGWLNVNQAKTGDTVLLIDRVGTVYFQYGENAEYNAGSPIEIDVGIQEHTVTFDVNNLNTKVGGYHFGDYTNDANLNQKFMIKVESGSQLCKCDDYIKGVTANTEDKKWGIYGYNMGSGERATTFLKKEDGTPFNEASIIDSDITLNMDFVPKPKANFIYTDSVIIDYEDFENINTDTSNNEVYSLTENVLNNFKENVYYGQPFDINVLKSFVCNGERVISDMDLRIILTKLDTSYINNQVVFKGLAVKANNSSNYQFIKNLTISDDTYEFTFTEKDDDVFPVRDDELFNYKFASLFQLIGVEHNPYFCSLDAVEGGCQITKLKAYDDQTRETGFASSNLKYRVSDDTIEFFHKEDIRAANDALVPDNGVLDDTGIGENPEYITVKFHAALIDGEFKPGFSEETKYKLRTVDTLSTVIQTVSQNNITLQDNWVVSKTE